MRKDEPSWLDLRNGVSDRPEWVEETIDAAGDRWWAVHRQGQVLAVAMFADAETAGAFAAGLIAARMSDGS